MPRNWPRKSEYRRERTLYWISKGYPPDGADSMALKDIEAVEAAGLPWDPEEPELPASLEFRDFGRFGPRVVTGDAEATWVAVTPPDTAAMVPGRETAFKGAVLRAMVAAYNREREEERMEAEVGPLLDEGIPRLLEMEIAKEVEAAVRVKLDEMTANWQKATEDRVRAERGRCASIIASLRDMLRVEGAAAPDIFEDVEDAIRRIESGTPPNPFWGARAAQAGAFSGQPLATPDGTRCALCGKDWPHGHTPEQLAEWEAQGGARGADDLPTPAPSGDTILREQEKAKGEDGRRWPWPESLAFEKTGTLDCWQVGAQRHGHLEALTKAEAEEVLRRWREEPRLRAEVEQLIRQKVKLQEAARVAEREREEIEQEAESMRLRINRGADYMRQNWPVTLSKGADGVKQGVILGLYRILAGKES